MDIFGMLFKKNTIDRYPENSKGDFYVQNDVCLSCGAPEAQASDLIEHSKLEYGHCYFKKQPQTEDEIERAINAIAVSCISGLRYGGKDEKILKRLYEIGESQQCDKKPIGNYKMLVWTKVTFKYVGAIKELSDNLTSQIILSHSYVKNKIVDFTSNEKDYFEFTYRWSDGLIGTTYKCNFTTDGYFEIKLDKEKDGHYIAVRGNAILLNIIICNDKNITEILWYDTDGNKYESKDLK